MVYGYSVSTVSVRQKAPSTRRCIKTVQIPFPVVEVLTSESTQHQKVH